MIEKATEIVEKKKRGEIYWKSFQDAHTQLKKFLFEN